jgi:hypothetical protein
MTHLASGCRPLRPSRLFRGVERKEFVPHDGLDVITIAVGKIVVQQVTPGQGILNADKRFVSWLARTATVTPTHQQYNCQ